MDEHIASTIRSGAVVSEVTLTFETQEQQMALVRTYR
jgi:hypothetical protein